MNALKSAISHTSSTVTSSTVTPSAVPSSTVEPQSQNAVRSTAPQAIAFIDAAVEGSEMLIQGMRPEVVAQRLETDALAQMTARLAQNSHVDEVHLVCHGEPGCLYLGDIRLDTKRLEDYAALLKQWFAPGRDAAIYLYGCQVTAGAVGTAFVERLAQLTGATVFASSRKVGGLQAGGVWLLDYGSDSPQPVELFSAAARMNYAGVFAAGDLVTSFGNGGLVTTDINGSIDVSVGIAVDPAGNVVVGGSALDPFFFDFDFAVVRYSHLGQADNSFGPNGTQITDFIAGQDIAYDMELDPEGNIFLAGQVELVPELYSFGLVKYDSSGSVDSSFGTEGQTVTSLSDSLNSGAVAFSSDGNIFVGGSDENNFTVTQFDSNGSLDSSFGLLGTASVAVGLSGEASDITIDARGRVLMVGEVGEATTDLFTAGLDFALVRFTSDGDRDSGFGVNGVVRSDIFLGNDSAAAVTTDASGNILIAGTSTVFNSNFALARYHSDGTLDQSFGTGGRVITDFSGGDDGANSIAIDAAGNILLGGYTTIGNNTDFAIARYLSDGSLDSSFGNGGKAVFDFGGMEEVIADLTLNPAGDIFATGIDIDLENIDAEFDGSSSQDFILFKVEGDRRFTAQQDFNGDAQADLLLYYPEEQFSGIGYVVGSGFPELSSLWTGWRPSGTGDFNQDGQTDIVVKNEDNGWNGILYMQGNTVQYSQGIAGWDDWEVIGVGNFNGDGTQDLMVRHQSQPWYGTLYMGGSDGNLVIASQGINVWEGWDVKATGDFNNDGRADLVVQNQTEDWFGILYLDVNQQISSSQGIVGWADWDVIGASDINSDGQVDLLIEHQSQPWNGAWHMDRNQIVSSQGLSTPAGWEIAA